MSFLNPKLGIDFSAYIVDRTLNFTGREWVFEAIQKWLADPKGDRFFLLTGEPGSGKTAIAARLAQFAQGTEAYPGFEASFLQAVHFCSARDSVWTDPKEFARSLALQLAQSIPKFGLALKDIEEKSNNISVVQTIDTVQNSLVNGVVIQNLTISGLTGQEAFTQVVVNPLRQIQQEGFIQPVMILVDSLDEALIHDGGNTIVDLLAKLASSVKLRLIVTSRDEARVKNVIKGAKRLFLSDPQDPESLQQNRKDVRTYAETRLTKDQDLVVQLESWAHIQQNEYIETITDMSEGNFLYIRFLLDAIAGGQRSITDLEGLPQGLDELYYESLERVVKLGKKDWCEAYAPIMGVLLAAQESLNLKQLAAFTGQGDTVISGCLNNLRQFLDKIELEEDEYRIYHQSVADFLGKQSLLIDGEKSDNLYYLSIQEQHERLLEYYHSRDKAWDEVRLEKIDPYGRKHLAQHLVKADRVEELHTLLWLDKDGKNAWFEIKDEAGDTAGFLADVNLAWELTEQNLTEATLPQVIERQCRYTLIISTLNSLSDIPTELLERLVKVGLPYGWSPEKGLAYARQVPNLSKRAKSLAVLLEYLPEAQQEKIWREALSAALAVRDGYHHDSDLSYLAANFPQELYKEALGATLAILDEYRRAPTLRELATNLPKELYNEALNAAQSFQNKYLRAEVLRELAANFPEAYNEALIAALAIQDEFSRAEVLRELAANFPEAYNEALIAALAIQDEHSRTRVLRELAANFPEAYNEALIAALAIQDESDRARVLRELATNLPKELYNEALNAAQSFQNKYLRAEVLRELAANFPEAYNEALIAALAIQDESDRARVLRELATNLPKELYNEALNAAQSFQNKYLRAEVLRELAANFPEAYNEALIAALAIQDESDRARVLRELAANFPEAYNEALIAALAIQDESDRARVLIALHEFERKRSLRALETNLPQELYKEALIAALAIQDERSRARILSALVENSPEAFKEALIAALFDALVIQCEPVRTGVPIELAANLPQELYGQALRAVLTIQDEYKRHCALIALAANYFPKAFKGALSDVLAIHDESDLANALRKLAVNLPQKFYKDALGAALTIQDECSRANVLIELASNLPQELYEEALSASQAIWNKSLRAGVLSALVEKFPAAFKEALSAALDIQSFDRANALMALAAKFPREFYKEVLSASLAIRDERSRAEVLIELTSKPHELYIEVLSASQTIQDESDRTRVLCELATNFLEAYKEALSTSQTIQDESDRANVLAAKFPQELYKEVLSASLAIRDECSRANALIALAKNFPEAHYEAFCAASTIRDERSRTNALIALAKNFPEPYYEAFYAASTIQDKFDRADSLGALAANLPQELYKEALIAALTIQNEFFRAPALSELIPQSATFPTSQQFTIWQEILYSGLQRNRPEFLSDLAASVPLIDSLGGKAAGIGIAKSIQQVAKWWR